MAGPASTIAALPSCWASSRFRISTALSAVSARPVIAAGVVRRSVGRLLRQRRRESRRVVGRRRSPSGMPIMPSDDGADTAAGAGGRTASIERGDHVGELRGDEAGARDAERDAARFGLRREAVEHRDGQHRVDPVAEIAVEGDADRRLEPLRVPGLLHGRNRSLRQARRIEAPRRIAEVAPSARPCDPSASDGSSTSAFPCGRSPGGPA